MSRTATLERKTRETRVRVALDLDGTGTCSIKTPLPFLSHMLEQIARHGAIDLEINITKGEHDVLNPVAVNCIRAFPGRGIRVWGARTLSSDPEWRYLNVRRLFNYLEKSILNGTDWAVFEPNDWMLWGALRRNIGAFLTMTWRTGALFGQTPEQAYYVKCDEETNPPEAIDAGQVLCEIGVAPVKPAEFVIFRLAQYQGGGGETAEATE